MKLKISLGVILACWVLSSPVLAQGAYDTATFNGQQLTQLKLLRITPSGDDVPANNRQIVFKFDQPVVAVGDMQRQSNNIPISITPAVSCQWLWLDTSSLSCQLNKEDQLSEATQYSLTVQPGIKTMQGIGMTESVSHTFITQRPKLASVNLVNWSRAALPLARLNFNQPVTKSSLVKHVHFNANTKIRIIADRDANPLTDSYYLQEKVAGPFTLVTKIQFNHADQLKAEIAEREVATRAMAHDEARLSWSIAPAQDLPANTRVSISIGAGIKSILGDEAGLKKPRAHTFTSLPEFEYLGIRCIKPGTDSRFDVKPIYKANDRLRDEKSGEKVDQSIPECDPLAPVSLLFSTPVSYATAKDHLQLTPDLAGGVADYDPWTTRNDRYYLESFFRSRFNNGYNIPYSLTLPESLKAYEQYQLLSSPALTDEVGRNLSSTIDMGFLTAHRSPRLWLNHRHSVLEKGVESELPITVTNLKQLRVENYSRTTVTERKEALSSSLDLADAQDVAYAVSLGVRKLLQGKSGVVVGQLASTPITANYYPDHYLFMSQVTPYQVHFKFGHFNSYAWVSDMATGKPVKGASVALEINDYLSINPLENPLQAVKTDKDGIAILPGIAEFDPNLKYFRNYRFSSPRIMLKVAKGNDMAVLPLDYEYAARSQLWPRLRTKDSYLHAWGTTAQGVYKAGDTIQYKFYVRNQSNKHWIAPPKDGYTLEVVDPKGQTVQNVKNLQLSDFGAYSGELTTTPSAAVGWYAFKLRYSRGNKEFNLSPMKVLVSDFTPVPFRVTNEINGDRFGPGDQVTVTSLAEMHAGGPYADAETRIIASVQSSHFSSSHPEAKGFHFGYGRANGSNAVHQSSAMLNKNGELVTNFKLEDYQYRYGRLFVESAVRDDRGKYVASSVSADYIGRDRFVGLRNSSWVHNAGKATSVEALVVDGDGTPVAGSPIEIQIEHYVSRAARVKGAGNAYLTQYSSEWLAKDTCSLISSLKAVKCEFIPEKPGRYRFTASVKDTKQRDNSSTLSTWVVGEGVVVWNNGNRNQLEIVPDAESYKIGDVARFLIKNPYPGAQALVTVERYGVLRHFQQTLKGSTPVIEVPIKADDYPGIYVSVVVTSPRVTQPLGEGNVDLGKPTFRLGYVSVPVRDDNKEIGVSIKTDKQVYKPRDTVKVALAAKPRRGKKEPMEVAVVVIDEAVFDLNRSGKNYYDPYQGFNKLEQLGVGNYNLLMKLIGRQKFEKKGANPGGGGGSDNGTSLRNLMKFVSYWNPSIELNKRGQAEFEFELPDNLTGWRVFAMAVTKEERMGLGNASFKVNRPTELRPVMPNQLTEGDQVQAGFSVMNRTNKPRTLTVELSAAGDALQQPITKTLTLELDAYQRKRVWLPVKTAKSGEMAFLAKAGDALDSDAVEHHVPVNKRRSLITAASYGTTSAEKVSEEFAFPAGIYSDVGGLSVTVSPSVIGNVSGAFRYLRDYPYACWEQRLSKGLAAAQYGKLKKYLPDDLTWNGSASLPASTLANAVSFQAPNGGMTYWVNRDAYVSPYLSAYTAIGFVWLREQGYTVPEKVEEKLHDYLREFLRRDDSTTTNKQQMTHGMRSSIRAVALAALAKRGKIDKQDLARYQQHLPDMDLFGKAHFLQAATSLNLEDEKLIELSKNILSYSVQSGGKFQFNESISAEFDAMLSTPMRGNCAILSSLLGVTMKSQQGRSIIGDVPFKQVRAIAQTRGSRDYWANTQENIFCMNALVNFSKVYESDSPFMHIKASMLTEQHGAKPIGETEFTDLRDPTVTLANASLQVESNLSGQVALSKQGTGRVYYSVRMNFAKTEDNAEPINAGIEVRREYSVQRDSQWQLLTSPMQLEKGELVRVDLFVSVPTARNFVVIDDPVPGGLEPVNRDLATSSNVDANHDSYVVPENSWWHNRHGWSGYGRYGYSFYHKELRHDSARFYSDYLPQGDYHLSYTAQAIAGGSFSVMPLKVEEMYDPDIYGLGLPATLNVNKAVD